MLAKMLADARAVAIHYEGELSQAKQLREEAEAVLVRYTERASHAQAEAQTILTQAKEEAERFARESEVAPAEGADRARRERIRRAWDSHRARTPEPQAMAEIRAHGGRCLLSLLQARSSPCASTSKQASALIDGDESIKDLGEQAEPRAVLSAATELASISHASTGSLPRMFMKRFAIAALAANLLLAGCGIDRHVADELTTFNEAQQKGTAQLVLLNVLRARDRQPLAYSHFDVLRGGIGNVPLPRSACRYSGRG